jgi:NifU-like protein involved in Fe-S cluster formation
MSSYSALVEDHFLNPRNAGEMENPDGLGTEGVPGEGNYMVIAVRVREGVIESARFQTHGCPAAIACGSALTEWATGLPLSQGQAITSAELEARLGGLPLGKGHCAHLAVAALRKALEQVRSRASASGPDQQSAG